MDSLLKGAKQIRGKKKSLCTTYLLISELYLKIKDTISSVVYLRKIDSVYHEEPQVIEKVRESFMNLYKIYKAKKDLKKQVKYINYIMSVDSVLKNNYYKLGKEITQKYDNPKLLEKKEEIIQKLEGKSIGLIRNIWLLSFLVIGISTLASLNIHKNIRYKNKIRGLVKKYKENDENENTEKSKLEISKEIVEEILIKLDKFETSNRFVEKKYTLNSLAKELKTNTSYLSKIINLTKNSSFSTYLNNLKVDYIVARLDKEKKLRFYTLKAIAEEAGFNNASTFSTAFKKKMGVSPLEYIKRGS